MYARLTKYNYFLWDPDSNPFHLAKHEVVETATCNKYLLVNHDVTIMKTIIQYIPVLLQNPKRTLHTLSDTLQICREVFLEGHLVCICIGANQRWPVMIAVISNQMNTSILLNSALCSTIFPTNIIQPFIYNEMYIAINLNNLLVIPRAELWTIVKVSNTLKGKSEISRLTLRAIVMPVGKEDHIT
jgi:hypothetical protein